MTLRKRNRLYLILFIALILLVALAVYKSKTQKKGEEVETAKVEMRTIKELVSASGKIFPEKEVVISSDVSGEVVKLMVEEGDSIQTGDLLALIDPEAYESAVERGRASVNNAKAQLAISKSNAENAKAQKAQIEAQYQNAKRIYDRNKQLYDQGVLSKAEYETSLADLDAMRANLLASEASQNSAHENINANEFSVKSVEASLKELQTSLKRTNIFAPVDGIISRLDIEEGERVVGTIQMTGTEMMRIANLSVMEVQVDVSENDILRVSLGDTAEIEVDAYLDRKFLGMVTEIANSASTIGTAAALTTDQVTNFVVKIRMDAASYKDLITPLKPFPFRPGMSASVEINTNTEKDVMAVPILAVTTRDINETLDKDGAKDLEEDLREVVFKCLEDTVQMVQVETGIQDDTYILILEGLSLDEEVVSGPYSVISRKLKQGDFFRRKEKKSEDKEDE
ncbi:MAG: efflux RND transporter periplasmic adaptor subunit [Saprospiraceae bacterium]|nr:efflux RND transporter periplasmic adaptor subunit [Saprospiraceae bacterium]